MPDKSATVDKAIAWLAARQHGVVSIGQIVAAGMSRDAVSRRARAGRLHRVHRGVYAVGHLGLSRHGRWMAAALTCGEGAAISHRSAAELWGLLRPASSAIHVTVPSKGGRKRRVGIQLHRCSSLSLCDVTVRAGIPVTKPARTISDLRGAVADRELRHATRQAEVLGLPIDEVDVERDRTRSDLEREFLWLCHSARLPAPRVNSRVGPFLVDFLWREPRLIVETDGYRYHRGRQAFEDDRARDLELRARGFEVVRLSGKQVSAEPERVVAVLRAAIAGG